MKRFKNISELNSDTCKILLYGYIGPWDDVSSAGFVAELDLAAQYYSKAELHINSGGGDVFEGIAIFNAIRTNKMDITIYIDGVAASIAFVIAMCGRKVLMSKYARMMAHGVSGGVYGNVTEFEKALTEIKTVQDILVAIVAERTGLPESEVTSKWFDGADHWLSASEALDLKLINEIYDAPPVDIPAGETNPKRIFNLFNNTLNPFEMKWENFFKRFNLRNEATEQEAIDEIAKIEKKAADNEALVNTLKSENDVLKAKLTEKEAAEKAAEETEINTAVENAVKDGRIQDAQKPHYTAILKADKTNGLAIMNALPKGKRIVNALDKTEGDEERAKWTFDDWSKKDAKGLSNMKVNDPDAFKVLFKNAFGKEPKI